jgi:ParB-like chromosome segregation protein Spo0J
VVDQNGVIIVGHVRLLAAQQLELTEIPVHVATELTVAQVNAYRLADNPHQRRGHMGHGSPGTRAGKPEAGGV